jgi:probable HAF family extracellular repeat protein
VQMPFLWKDGVLTNLGTLDVEACSAALGINSRSQVVGVSATIFTFTASDRHAFLWENGRVIDLNTFSSMIVARLPDWVCPKLWGCVCLPGTFSC